MKLPAKRDNMAVEIPDEVKDLFDLGQNIEGSVPRLPQIKIIHAGQLFELPDQSKPEFIEGIIIDKHSARAWWEKTAKESGGVTRPDCCSYDGKYPDENSTQRQNNICADCNKNQFGSDTKGGRGKACKEMRRMYLLMENSVLPKRLTAGPTSLTNFDSYMTDLLDMGLPFSVCVTRFSLEKKESDGNTWSIIHFDKQRVLHRDEILAIAQYIKKYRGAAKEEEIQSDEYFEDQDTSFEFGENEQGGTPPPQDDDIPY